MATVVEARESGNSVQQPSATDGNSDIAYNESLASAENESKRLLEAAYKGDVDMVERLIDGGVHLSATDGYGQTALHKAVEEGHVEIAELLLAKDESLANTADNSKSTPLHRAAVRGIDKMCKLLLHHKASLTAKDEREMTALHWALESGWHSNEEVVHTLISAEEEDRVEGTTPLVDAKSNNYGMTPLDSAFSGNRSVNLVAWMLSKSSQPASYFTVEREWHSRRPVNISTYLREGSRMGYVDLVKALVDAGADPFEEDDEGKTAIHYTVEGALDVEVAVEIIGHLGGVNWRKALAGDKYGRNFFHLAAFLGKVDLCSQLLDRHRDLMDTKDRDGQTAIFYVVAGPHDNLDVFREFISRAQSTNLLFVKDSSQTTPLHVAAARGNLKMCRALLEVFSDEEPQKIFSDEEPKEGEEFDAYSIFNDPSKYAKYYCETSDFAKYVFESLYEDGNRRLPTINWVKETDVLGQTALHKAASGGHCTIVEMLLKYGAHPLKERDCDGKTALHFAAEADGEDAVKIAELLLQNCESNKQRALLLFASAVGIGLPNSSPLQDYLEKERSKIEGQENLLRVAATLGDTDMSLQFITEGASIALISDEQWTKSLPTEEQKNVRDVLKQIKTIVEQGTDKPALQDNLGRSAYAIGLAALFLNPFMRSPLTVGISGEWGMGKSSVMLQTETILLRTAAQLAFSKSFQEDSFPGQTQSELSATGHVRLRKIANVIERLDGKSKDGPNIIHNIQMFIKQVNNFRTKVMNQQKFPKLCKVWKTVRALWNESAPFTTENLQEFNKFLENDQPKYHLILKSLAIMDRHYMFKEKEETGSGNKTAGKMPWEEDSLHGITPSILTVRYNAWHYRNEAEAWAGLAVEITKELEAAMTVAHKLRTSWRYNWKNCRESICLKVIFPFILQMVVAIFLSVIVWVVFGTAHNKDIKKLKYGGVPASMIVAAWGLGKSVVNFVKPITSQVQEYLRMPDHSQKLGYQQKVIADINFLKDQLSYRPTWMWKLFAYVWCCIMLSWGENYVPETKICKFPPASDNNLRIIVFVDDLDRCEESVILQVLSAVNLVLGTCEINVILSMENRMIERAIIRKYGNSNSKSKKSNEELADNYLRKIVQLPLHLPDPSDKESSDFLKRQLGMWDNRKACMNKMDKTHEHRKVNPKYQIGTSSPNKPKRDTDSSDSKSRELNSGAEQQTTARISECSGVEQMIEIGPINKDEQGDQEVPENRKIQRSLLSIISAMLIPKYSEGERNAFHYLHTRCTRNRKLPREWKCFMTYHRLGWNILYLSPDIIPVEGWQVQFIAWIFVCWQWRHLITTLIQKWNKLKVLRNWKAEEGPSLREIVEHYIDEKWPVGQDLGPISTSTSTIKAGTQQEPEKNITANPIDEDNYLKKVLREQEEMREVLKKVQKDQEEMREVFEKVLKDQEDMLKMIMRKVFKEEEDKEGESSVEQYKTAEDEEEQEEWIKLRNTLRHYNISMKGIQAFQKFRFYCQPGHLPWPLPEQD